MSLAKTTVIIGFVILSIGMGSAYAVFSLKAQARNQSSSIKNGCWIVNSSMDLNNKYQRALVSIVGLFALRESEVLYFVASEDDEGQPLRSEYNYTIEGPAPDARYWSYTLYGSDFFLVPNNANKYGYNLDNIQFIDESDNPELPNNAQGNHQITIS